MPVVSIDFDNLVISAPANGVVTLKQGYTFGGALTADTTAVNFNYYVLSDITANKTLTLPAGCLLYTSPSPRDVEESRMPSSA